MTRHTISEMLHAADPERNCSKCNYDLLGLADQGRCPECGQRYNVLTGQGLRGTAGALSEAQQRADRILARVRTISLAAAATGLFLLCVVIETIYQQFGDAERSATASPLLWTGGFISVVIGMGAMLSWMNERSRKAQQ